jgi:antitoxin MazE
LLQQCQLEDEVELKAQPGQLVVRPVGSPRQGWEEAFEKIARYGNDAMLDVGGPAKDWSRKDWKW